MGASTIAECAGKQAFLRRQDAARVARIIGRRPPKHRMNVYKCGCCGRWHVGRMADDLWAQARDWKRKKRAMEEWSEE